MVRVSVVILVCNARDDTELLLVATSEAACKAFCRCCEHAEVVLVCLAELVYLASHEVYDTETEFLCLGRLAMVLSNQCDKGLSQSDESDTECTVVDYRLDSVIFTELIAVDPECTHKERELLLEGCLLEVESFVELLG